MINEHESKEVIMLAFRAIKFGEAEFLKAVQAYLKYRQNAPPQHGKVKLKELMQMDQGATMMEIRPEGVRGFQRIAKKYNVDFSITKDRTQNPPAYQVFFKGRDQEVIAKGGHDSRGSGADPEHMERRYLQHGTHIIRYRDSPDSRNDNNRCPVL